MTDRKVRVVYDMPDDVYRSGELFSYSAGKLMLSKSPAHVKLSMSQKRKPRTGMDDGTLIHELFLGGNSIVVIDAEEFRSKEDKAERDAVLATGRVPVKRKQYERAKVAVEELRAQLPGLGVKLSDKCEVSIFWDEYSSDGQVVKCRTRIDNLALPDIYDLKRTESADDDTCQRHIVKYGYDIQAAIELRAVTAAFPEWVGRLRFVDVFLETDEPPYLANPKELDPAFLALGEIKLQLAIDKWAACQASGEWQGYSTGISRIGPPPWEMNKYQDLLNDSSESAVDQW